MSEPASIQSFWQQYLDSLPETEQPRTIVYDFGPFGDTEEDAEECARLVMAGIKTATSGLVWEYEANHEKLTAVGDISIVTGREGVPQCVIEVTESVIKPFAEVDERFAFDYGEWDRTLAGWRKGNWAYFSGVCDELGRTPSETMPLVCQRFRVLYPK
jgi:uncharacterized protein YhfF